MQLSYRAKLVLILLGLVVVLQVSSYIATRTVIRDAVVEDAYRQLEKGSELFTQLMQTRVQQLAQSVGVLTDDFGFKDAVASADEATIRSALVNHAARIQADLAIVLDNQNQLVASSMEAPAARFAILERLAPDSGGSAARYLPVVIDGKLYQFVLSPIMAPLQIGTAGIGFEVDQSISAHLQSLTDLEVSFIAARDNQPLYLSGTLGLQAQTQLLAEQPAMQAQPRRIWRSGDMLSSAVNISREPQLITAVLQVPLSRALKPFAVLDTQLLTLAFSFVLGAVIIALLLARSVTRPVQQLVSVARHIAGGDYSSPIKVRGSDEFSQLAQTFNLMQSAIAERETAIRYHAEHDSLTGLGNRSQVVPQLESAMSECRAADKVLAVIIADICKFTQINDTLSSETGDRVLRAVGEQLASTVADKGVVLRLGSDEFLLLVTVDSETGAESVVNSLQECIDQPLNLERSDIKVELNLGFALYPIQGESSERLLRRANLALNHARHANEFICAYRQGWDEDHLRRLQLFADFKQALQSDEICLFFQPKIDPLRRENLGAEALIRWVHPEFGFVNPEEFIAVIESAGQIHLLTRWVLRTAANQVSQLRGLGVDLTMSINLSALDLLEDDFPAYIHLVLQESQLPASCFCLEITESAIMQEAERSLKNLESLHTMGLLISIDDYGTGYSSLSQMKRLPVSELKIDKSFVLELESNQEDRQIVRSTIELGHTLGLKVTAEGVETAGARDWLINQGCDILQGYFYSKPLPAHEFTQWVKGYLHEVAQ